MAELDLSRWGLFARKDDSGFGRMAMMLKSALGLKRHIAIPSDRLEDLAIEPPNETWLSPDASLEEVIEELRGLQGIVFFEHFHWHSRMLEAAKLAQVKTVCVPMWEWFSGHKPEWRSVDLLVCPSKWTLSVVRDYGYSNSIHVTWPVDVESLPERVVSGPARLFVHNAGLVDSQDRKGTADTIRAFKRVSNPELRLLVRMQKEADLPAGDPRVEVIVGNLPDFRALYAAGDVAIQPSKMEGIGFMVLEPQSCGIPTITTDYPPMNEYVLDPRFLVTPRWGKRKAFPTAWIRHAHLRLPQTGDLAKKIQWCSENDLREISQILRRQALERFDPRSVRAEWESALKAALMT